MNQKLQAGLGLILPAIGAGLVYVGYNSFFSVSADSPYAEKNLPVLITVISLGSISLIIGLVILAKMFLIKSNKK